MVPDDAASAILPITVKNTFIEISGPSPTNRRRSSSTPPGSSFSASTTFTIAEEEPCISACAGSGCKASSESVSSIASSSSSTPLANLRLNTRAKPYEPNPMGMGMVTQGPSYQELIGQTVISLASAIACCASQVQARVVDSQHGWLVDVEVNPFECMPEVLEHAKACLLTITEQSSHVYVMGYRSQPFQEKHNAFQATLGIMGDESLACWDAYSTGICYRGKHCRWQHPPFAKCLLVAVRPQLSSLQKPDEEQLGGRSQGRW